MVTEGARAALSRRSHTDATHGCACGVQGDCKKEIPDSMRSYLLPINVPFAEL